MKCSRKNVKIVLDRMIEAKANHLFMENNVVYGRWTRVLKHWWLRGLDENEHSTQSCSSDPENIDDKISRCGWSWNNEDGRWFLRS